MAVVVSGEGGGQGGEGQPRGINLIYIVIFLLFNVYEAHKKVVNYLLIKFTLKPQEEEEKRKRSG